MTALDKYTRLEALGQWRESPEHPPREVVVSFENETLVLSNLNERPLCHWAMAATSRLSLNGAKGVYTPDTEGFETLEIDDAEMIEAIAQVSSAVTAPTRRAPWLRWVFLTLVLASIGVAFYITPSVFRDQAVRMTGHESARKLGTDMLSTLNPDICREPSADAARELFQSRVFPDGRTLIVIVRDQQQASVFPGGVVILSGDALKSMRTPNELAALTTALAAKSEATTTELFDASSSRELFDYITSGKLSKDRLLAVAQSITDQSTTSKDFRSIITDQPLLRDQDWVALQNICLE